MCDFDVSKLKLGESKNWFLLEWGLIYCGVVFDGFLQRKQAKVTQRVETAIRAESTATWNEVKVGVESCVRCQKI